MINNGWWIDWMDKSGNQFKLHVMINRVGYHTQISFSFFLFLKESSSNHFLLFSCSIYLSSTFHRFVSYVLESSLCPESKKGFQDLLPTLNLYKAKHQANELSSVGKFWIQKKSMIWWRVNNECHDIKADIGFKSLKMSKFGWKYNQSITSTGCLEKVNTMSTGAILVKRQNHKPTTTFLNSQIFFVEAGAQVISRSKIQKPRCSI